MSMESGWSAERFKYILDESGLTLNDVAKATGISRKSLINFQKDSSSAPRLGAAVALADMFAVPLDYLVGRCDLETAKQVEQDYKSNFHQLGRAPYEAYLRKKESVYLPVDAAPPWPYNLLELIFIMEPWRDPLEPAQEEGFNRAIELLTENERRVILMRYRDGYTIKEISEQCDMTKEKVRSLESYAFRKLRHPMVKKSIQFGPDSVEKSKSLEEYRAKLRQEEYELTLLEKELQKRRDEIHITPSRRAMPVEDLCLSTRAYNSVYCAGCRSLGDILDIVKAGDLTNIRGLGEVSAAEILLKIKKICGEDYSELYPKVRL